MRVVAITQRVDVVPEYGERRDALDQKWGDLLGEAGLLPLILPNRKDRALALLDRLDVAGAVLTGGNDLRPLGGTAEERDDLEDTLLQMALSGRFPLLGVCRGMQVIQHAFGVQLERVEGHVARRHDISIDGDARSVNSYHHFGTTTSSSELTPYAVATDGVVEGVRHTQLPILGMMWHPEREVPFLGDDLAAIRQHFNQTISHGDSRVKTGTVYWVTGLSGSGKTTVGTLLVHALRENGRPVVFLDGDEIRNVLGDDLGHTLGDRRVSAMRNARMCRMVSNQGIDVVCCTISMFREVRQWNREHLSPYQEIYLKVPMDVLRSRDPKGIYRRAEAGEIENVYGVDLPWDEPKSPHVEIVNDGGIPPERIVSEILSVTRGAEK